MTLQSPLLLQYMSSLELRSEQVMDYKHTAPVARKGLIGLIDPVVAGPMLALAYNIFRHKTLILEVFQT